MHNIGAPTTAQLLPLAMPFGLACHWAQPTWHTNICPGPNKGLGQGSGTEIALKNVLGKRWGF